MIPYRVLTGDEHRSTFAVGAMLQPWATVADS